MAEVHADIIDERRFVLWWHDAHTDIEIGLDREQVGVLLALMRRWLNQATGDGRQATEESIEGQGAEEAQSGEA